MRGNFAGITWGVADTWNPELEATAARRCPTWSSARRRGYGTCTRSLRATFSRSPGRSARGWPISPTLRYFCLFIFSLFKFETRINLQLKLGPAGSQRSRGEERAARGREGLQDLGLWADEGRLRGRRLFEAQQGTRYDGVRFFLFSLEQKRFTSFSRKISSSLDTSLDAVILLGDLPGDNSNS